MSSGKSPAFIAAFFPEQIGVPSLPAHKPTKSGRKAVGRQSERIRVMAELAPTVSVIVWCMTAVANGAGTFGSILAETVSIDGGVVMLFLLVMLILAVGFIGLCWTAYKAGAGNRTAQYVVGLVSMYLMVMIFNFGINSVIPVVILAGFAWIGRARSKR